MQIDWFTLIAQIVNFVILLYLLQRFLYGPIVQAMDEREKKIADKLREAEQKRKEADEQSRKYQEQRHQLEEEHDERLAAMQVEIEERRKNLLENVQLEVEEQKHNWLKSLNRDQEEFLLQLRQQVSQEVLAIARHTLEELADRSIEKHLIDRFLSQIQQLDSSKKDEIKESIQKLDDTIVVRSAFALSADQQKKIIDTVQSQIMHRKIPDLIFEKSSNLIAGIEMQINSLRVAWAIQDYLTDLEENIGQLIRKETGTQVEVERDA